MNRNKDILIIGLVNFLLLVLLFLSDVGWNDVVSFLRIPFGIFYLVFVPGYAIQAAFFPSRSHLVGLDRLAVSVGLSVAIMPILGLVLDGPLGGIFLWQSIIFLSLVTGVFSFAAVYRRSRLKEDLVNTPEDAINLNSWWHTTGNVNRLMFVMFIVVIFIAVVISVVSFSTPKPDQLFTELYIVGPDDIAVNYPRDVVANQPFTIKVGVGNYEKENFVYSLQAQLNGRTLAATAPFTLTDGQSISLDMSLTASDPGDQQLMEILLLHDNQVYRRLYLWMNVKSP